MPTDLPNQTIDVHAHALSPRLVELTADHQGPPNPHNDHLMQTRYRAPFDSIDVRLETMERQGISMQVVSHVPNFGYWADRDVAEQIVMAANTLIADMCRDHPTRFVGLGLVALQFPELAARQLEDGMTSMGMRGVEIATRVNDMELDDERLEPFWAAADYEPRNLAHLIREIGASQVVLGTDYPFDMGEEHPVEVLEAVEGISAADRERILRGNALDLLGLPA